MAGAMWIRHEHRCDENNWGNSGQITLTGSHEYLLLISTIL